MDLFTTEPTKPLAELMRPVSVADIVGQSHILGPGKPLRMAFDAKRLHSFILFGPPGTGKTTISRLAAKVTDSQFLALSAVLAGVKDIREAIEKAQTTLDHSGRKTVIFIDEIHAFNKSQQDALLAHVESGLLTLIGATTEHPGMQVNNALLSRVQVYALEALQPQDMKRLHERAKQHLEGVKIDDMAIDLLISYADGDGRRFLGLLEQVRNAAVGANRSSVDEAFAANATSATLRRSDKDGSIYYDQISAFHKSVRGSHPDAALYWMARMLEGGVDPRQITRRMISIASEDIGNADPRALQLAMNAAEAVDRQGLPECELAMAQAATFLACAPKSNAAYKAWKQAKAFVKDDVMREVPLHLRNAPSKLMKEMGYGQGYRYAHDEPNGYAAGASFLPEGMHEPGWYQPTDRGLESKISERLRWLRSLDDSAR